MPNATWLKPILEAAGVNVVEMPGWEARSADGVAGPIKGVVCHHTVEGNPPVLDWIVNGRPAPNPLPGPLANIFLNKSGVAYLCAAGRANHAGTGSWQGVTDGNGQMIGIESLNAGDFNDPWPAAQIEALGRICAAILNHINATSAMCCGHKEWKFEKPFCPTLNMGVFRTYVGELMAFLKPHPPLPSVPGNIALPPPPPEPVASVVVSALNMRSQGNPNSSIVTTLHLGDQGAVLGSTLYDGTVKWLKLKLLAPHPMAGTQGWVREKASDGSPYVTVNL